MNRMLAGVAALVLAGATDAQAQQKKVNPAQFGWHADYDAARAEAKRTGKPIMLVFRCEP